jgi:DNA-binding MarR family transcriptional regulator
MLHVKLTEAEFLGLATLARKREITMSDVIREYLSAQSAR